MKWNIPKINWTQAKILKEDSADLSLVHEVDPMNLVEFSLVTHQISSKKEAHEPSDEGDNQ